MNERMNKDSPTYDMLCDVISGRLKMQDWKMRDQWETT